MFNVMKNTSDHELNSMQMSNHFSGDNRHADVQLVQHLSAVLNQSLKEYGFETAPFLTGWYNQCVSDRLKLVSPMAPHQDCVAFCIISNPEMFEKSFLPLLTNWFQRDHVNTVEAALRSLKFGPHKSVQTPGIRDPLDWSVFVRLHSLLDQSLKQIAAHITEETFDLLSSPLFVPDFALRPVTRFPYIHVQCAGHVSGIAYFHRVDQPDPNLRNINGTVGCSLHPAYGGWFGFRGVFVFPSLRCPDLPRPEPTSSLPPGRPPFQEELVAQLLDEYKNNWRGYKWRDFGLPPEHRQLYSAAARTFFTTLPGKRADLVEQWMTAECHGGAEKDD